MVKINQSPKTDNKKGNKFQRKPGFKDNKKFGKSFKPNLKGGKKEGFQKNIPKDVLKNIPRGFQKNTPKEGFQKNSPKKGFQKNNPKQGFQKNTPKEGIQKRNNFSKNFSKEMKNKKPDDNTKNGKQQISPKNNKSGTKIKNGKQQISPENKDKSRDNTKTGEEQIPTKNKDKKIAKEDIKNKNIKAKKAKNEKKQKTAKLEELQADLIKLPTESTEEKDDGTNFNKEDFLKIVNVEKVENIVKALQTKLAAEKTNINNKMFSDYRYILDVMCFKIPKCPKRTVKVYVKHSLVDKEHEVCFIAADLERGMRADYESTIQHYEDLFKENGIEGISKIIPFNQIKKEYSTYEMKVKLSNMYDYYLCDGRIAGHLHGFLGKKFRKSRSTVFAVRMNARDLASEFKRMLSKVSYLQGSSGGITSIPVGTDKFTSIQVAENIINVVQQLKILYPGGYPNIRGMYIKANIVGSGSLPIFLSAAKAPEKTPIVIGTREKKLDDLQKKIVPSFTKFVLNKAGEIVPAGKKSQNDETTDNVNNKRKAVDNVQETNVKNSKKVKTENIKKEKSLPEENKKKKQSSTKELTKLEMLKAPELGTTSNFRSNENVEGEDDEDNSEDNYESYEEDSEEDYESYEEDEEADEEGDDTDLDEDDSDNSDDDDDDETEDEENENEDEEDDSSDDDENLSD